MVSVKGAKFQGKRAIGLIRTLLSNRMAAVGLLLLLFFTVMAFAAPLFSPTGPYITVSGSLAQPDWVTSFPDGYYLSRNIVVGSDPSFLSPATLTSEWKQSSGSGVLSQLPISVSYSSTYTADKDPGGSVKFANNGGQTYNATLSQTFNFPYRGPPRKFGVTFLVLAPNSSQTTGPVSNSTQAVHITIFMQRLLDGQVFKLYDSNDTSLGKWIPSTSLDSSSKNDKDSVRKTMGTLESNFDPAEIIFAAQSDYTFGVTMSLPPGQVAYLDALQLKLYGTAWGLLGTDNAGRDLWSQLVYGSQISLAVGLSAAGIGIGLGLLVGLMAGFLGKVVDEALMRFTDMMLVIPGLPLLIVLVAVLGQSILNVVIIIGFFGWMGFARIVRSQVLSLRERPFVEAAKASGAGSGRIIYKHIFPNIVSLTYVNLALSVPGAILTEAALAFLGLSDPSVVSWGNIFSNVREANALTSFHPSPWWWVLPPGFAIAAVSLSFVLIGYALDEIFNPKLRRRR